MGFGGKLSGLGPLGAGLLKTEPPCVIQFTDLGWYPWGCLALLCCRGTLSPHCWEDKVLKRNVRVRCLF